MFRRIAIHPFLFVAYPIVFLLAANLQGGQASFSSVVVPLLLAVACAAAAFIGLWLVLRHARKAAVVVSLYVLLFFSYGHVRSALGVASGTAGDSILFGLWLVLAVAGTILVARAKGGLEGPTLILNAAAALLLVMNLIPMAAHAVGGSDRPSTAAGEGPRLPTQPTVAPDVKRDIYYLIFDRYANEPTLAANYDFDNSRFLELLERRGFYVAHDSTANYPRTGHSLASSLNLRYLNYLEREEGSSGRGWDAIYRLLREAEVPRYLGSLGYRYHHIGSWWNPTAEVPEADVNHVYDALSEFSSVLLRSTMWPAIGERLGLEEQTDRRAAERRRVAYQLRQLLSVEEDPAPTFTMAHFLIPHPPYAFDRNGGAVTKEIVRERGGRRSYVEQLLYTNRVIEQIVTELLDTAGEDPIIVIQSDEGPHPSRLQQLTKSFNWFEATDAELETKLGILNAYYLPGHHDGELYQAISPVNTFRVIFNEYYGSGLKLLPDRVFVYRDFYHPYDFLEITERLGR